jgi:phage shock protein PspC (stress-responsive transcriptional regulator)
MSTSGDSTAQDTTAPDAAGQDYEARPPFTQPPFIQPQGGAFSRLPVRRAVGGRMIAGVCAGLADYLGVDVTIIRVAFAVFAVMGGAGIPAYLACLLLIPEEGTDESIAGALIDSLRHGL